MADTLEPEVAKRQLTKEILEDLGVRSAITGKFGNIAEQAEQLINEYGKYYCQLYRYINAPLKTE